MKVTRLLARLEDGDPDAFDELFPLVCRELHGLAKAQRGSRIVECRFFGGMTINDTAEAIGVSPATVKRGWSVTLAWPHRDLKRSTAFERRSSARFAEGAPDDEG